MENEIQNIKNILVGFVTFLIVVITIFLIGLHVNIIKLTLYTVTSLCLIVILLCLSWELGRFIIKQYEKLI
mgnify:CR=1 FL=1